MVMSFRNETQILTNETLSNLARFLLVVILIHSKDEHHHLLVELVL